MASGIVEGLRARADRAWANLHWNDHAGQLGRIRQAIGLPAAKG